MKFKLGSPSPVGRQVANLLRGNLPGRAPFLSSEERKGPRVQKKELRGSASNSNPPPGVFLFSGMAVRKLPEPPSLFSPAGARLKTRFGRVIGINRAPYKSKGRT